MNRNAIVGCVLGTAVGDALGLPYEKLSRGRAAKLLGPPDRYRLVFRRGMISDDTEHTCMVAQSLIESGGDVDRFRRRFARRMRWWIASLPAGTGKATARAAIRLWLGISPERSGVSSAGNGPAMRAAIFGAALDDPAVMMPLLQASSRLTHTDPKAHHGAVAIALATSHARTAQSIDAHRWLADVTDSIGDQDELTMLLGRVVQSTARNESTLDFANSIGLDQGVSGYTYHTVPIAIHAWLSYPDDFREAITIAIRCGGDADTTAAIVGGIVGARVGEAGIPAQWLDHLWEWPRSVAWMRNLGEQLGKSDWVADAKPSKSTTQIYAVSPTVNPLAIVLRNACFLSIVLFHGLRRLAPPY